MPHIDSPFGGGMQFEQPVGSQSLMMAVPPGAPPGGASDNAFAAIVTAQRVAVKRNLPAILAEAKALATAAGDRFYYSIPFRKKQEDGSYRTEFVEGPSIGCTMAAISAYGNCRVEAFPADDTATHWTFMARFIDYEKGVTVVRSFKQRKNQDMGIRDRGRSEDIVFQSGQSKGIRNVVVAGLKWLTDEMFAAAKSGVLERIGKAPDEARRWLAGKFQTNEIALGRVERVIGRTIDKWNARDMARLFAELQAIGDGFADAADLYPVAQAEADEMREGLEGADGGKVVERTAEPKPASKRAPAKKAPETVTAAASDTDGGSPAATAGVGVAAGQAAARTAVTAAAVAEPVAEQKAAAAVAPEAEPEAEDEPEEVESGSQPADAGDGEQADIEFE